MMEMVVVVMTTMAMMVMMMMVMMVQLHNSILIAITSIHLKDSQLFSMFRTHLKSTNLTHSIFVVILGPCYSELDWSSRMQENGSRPLIGQLEQLAKSSKEVGASLVAL